MNFLKDGLGVSRKHDRAMEIGRPLTPRSEMSRSSRGHLLMGVSVTGLCPEGKCFRREGHDGTCYPQ